MFLQPYANLHISKDSFFMLTATVEDGHNLCVYLIPVSQHTWIPLLDLHVNDVNPGIKILLCLGEKRNRSLPSIDRRLPFVKCSILAWLLMSTLAFCNSDKHFGHCRSQRPNKPCQVGGSTRSWGRMFGCQGCLCSWASFTRLCTHTL